MIERPFYINRPRREALDPVTQANLGLRGHVEWQVREADGAIARQGERDNLILDQGLNMLPDRWIADCFTSCCVGTGNSAPAAGQTGLDLEIARTNTYQTADGDCGTTLVDPVTWQMKRTFSFPAGTLDSSRDGNYKEIGVSYTNTPGQNLFARTLFSSADAPAELAITSTQSLWVVYTLTISCGPAAVTAGSLNITGLGDTPYTHAIQDIDKLIPATLGKYEGYVGIGFSGINPSNGETSLSVSYAGGRKLLLEPRISPSFQVPLIDSVKALDDPGHPTLTASPTNQFTTSPTVDAYIQGSFYSDLHIMAVANEANFAISRIHFGYPRYTSSVSTADHVNYSFAYALRFDNPIVKENVYTFEMVFRLSWGRA
ncbi:MAG TPA: hypothetical protein VFL54_04540 [Gammaproteobacteria bacterium]|nr:hypothetical protein [Gammaproteobacteria bacterium]